MARNNDYAPVSEDGGRTWIIKSKSTGKVLHVDGRPEKLNSKREAQLEAEYQNKSAAGKAWALLRRDPCAVGE